MERHIDTGGVSPRTGRDWAYCGLNGSLIDSYPCNDTHFPDGKKKVSHGSQSKSKEKIGDHFKHDHPNILLAKKAYKEAMNLGIKQVTLKVIKKFKEHLYHKDFFLKLKGILNSLNRELEISRSGGAVSRDFIAT